MLLSNNYCDSKLKTNAKIFFKITSLQPNVIVVPQSQLPHINSNVILSQAVGTTVSQNVTPITLVPGTSLPVPQLIPIQVNKPTPIRLVFFFIHVVSSYLKKL